MTTKRVAVRTLQDLLAERRANVLEAMREPDTMAQRMLWAHIYQLDAELDRRVPRRRGTFRPPDGMGEDTAVELDRKLRHEGDCE